MAFRSIKETIPSTSAFRRYLSRFLIWPAAGYVVCSGLGFGMASAMVAAGTALLAVAAIATLPFRSETVVALAETLLATAVVALAGGPGSAWLLLFPWLLIDYGFVRRSGVVVLVLSPAGYLASAWWADGGLPAAPVAAMHAVVFLLTALYASRPGYDEDKPVKDHGYAGFGARREDRLLNTALGLFAGLAEQDDGFDGGRGTRALARVLPVFAEGDQSDREPEVTLRRFNPRELLENACWNWSHCARVRGLDLQGFAVPSDSPLCFGDPGRTAYILDLLLFAGCFDIEAGSVMVRLELEEGDRDDDRMVLTLQVTGQRQIELDTGIVGAAVEYRAKQLGGSHFALGSPSDVAWRVELPIDLEHASEEPPRRLAGQTILVTGESVLRAVMEAYVQAEGAVLTDAPDQARALLLAEPARAPETEPRCQDLKHQWPRLPLLCQGATPGTPAALLAEADAVIPVPFTRDQLVRLISQQVELAETAKRAASGPRLSGGASLRGKGTGPDRVSGSGVLVAEDDAISARVVSRFLEAEGCTVHRVKDGETALEALKRETPMLALLDMHMPGLGGVEVAERFREWEREQGREPTPLVALTASAAEEDRRACTAAGMEAFLNKPVDREALREILGRFSIARAKA